MSSRHGFLPLGTLCLLAAASWISPRQSDAGEARPKNYVLFAGERVERALEDNARREDFDLAEGSLTALGWFVLYGNEAESTVLAGKLTKILFDASAGTERLAVFMSDSAFGEMLNLGRFEKRKPISPSPEYERLVKERVEKALSVGAGPADWKLAKGSLCALGWLTLKGNDPASLALADQMSDAAAAAMIEDGDIYSQRSSEGYTEMINLGRFKSDDSTPRQSRFTDQGDETVLDVNTGLVWLKKPSALPPTPWSKALADVAAMPGGWRLPTNAEWTYMVPSARTAAGHGLFAVDWSLGCWSSKSPLDAGTPFHVSLAGNGGTDPEDETALLGVWPIRVGIEARPPAPVQPTRIASDSVLRANEVIPIDTPLVSKNDQWAIAGHEGWFVVARRSPADQAGAYWGFGGKPADAEGQTLFLKLGDAEDKEPGFYIYFLDAAKQRHILWRSPENVAGGSELRVQDSGRIEYIGVDGIVKGFFLGLGDGWEKGWQIEPPATPPAPASPPAPTTTPAPVTPAAPAAPVKPIGDVTRPGDPVTAIPPNGGPFAGQQVAQAIDDDPGTKFFNKGSKAGYEAPMADVTGLTVTPSVGSTVVTGLALTSGNDSIERDPASFKLEGSNDGAAFALIAEGPVPAYSGRSARQEISFANQKPFTMYRLTFPTLANPATAGAMQIGEVELLGR